MAVKLYMDVHIPKAITEQLRRRGVDVITIGQFVTDLEIIALGSEPDEWFNTVEYLPF